MLWIAAPAAAGDAQPSRSPATGGLLGSQWWISCATTALRAATRGQAFPPSDKKAMVIKPKCP